MKTSQSLNVLGLADFKQLFSDSAKFITVLFQHGWRGAVGRY